MRSSAPAPAAATAAQHAAAKSGDDTVAAVSVGKGGLPVDVRFALRDRPEVGQSARLDLLVIPSAAIDRVVTSVHADAGLHLEAGAEPTSQDRPQPGVPISHPITFVAQRDGLFEVDATVLIDAGGESVARTYTIPVIAGAGAGAH